MQAIGAKTVFEERKTEKKEFDLEKKEEKAQVKADKDEKSPLQKLISYVELAGIVYLMSKFKKPLITVAMKVGKDIEAETIKITTDVEKALAGVELILRRSIVQSIMLDPILCYKIGGNIYNELVYNAKWYDQDKDEINIFYTDGPIPSTVSKTFIIGTGVGATTVNASYVRGLSVQILTSLEYLIASGRDLTA